MLQPWLHPVSGIWYFRRKVPDGLREVLGYTEDKKSLRTRDPADARRRFAAALVESDHRFQRARRHMAGEDSLGLDEAHRLAGLWLREEQARIERSGAFTDALVEGATWGWGDNPANDAAEFVPYGEAEKADHEFDLTAIAQREMDRVLTRNGVPHPRPSTREHTEALAAFVEHAHRLSNWAAARRRGVLQPEMPGLRPLPPSTERHPPRAIRAGRKLSDLYEKYAANKRLNDSDNRATKRTLKAYNVIVTRFVELHGNMQVADISPEVVGEFRVSLSKMPSMGEGVRGSLTAQQLIAKAAKEHLPVASAATVRNKLKALSAVLSHGVSLQWMPDNPIVKSGLGTAAAKAAKRRSAAARTRREYTKAELASIFASPIYSSAGWKPPRADFGKAWYWLPLLMFYTGARREELAQLSASDVRCSDEGIWYLDVLDAPDDLDDGRTVKTAGSRRRIPIHADLTARGFLTFADEMSPFIRLFPGLKADPAGYYGSNFGKRWATYLREVVKLDSPAKPSHGFRHSFKTLCREADIPSEVHDAITGHSDGANVGRDYGSMPLKRMADAISAYPSLATIVGD